MKFVNSSVTVVPLTATSVTGLFTLFDITLKSLASGAPVTASLVVKVTVLVPAVAARTLNVGIAPSMTKALLADSEPASPAATSVSVAVLPAVSSMVPLFSVSAFVPV